MTQTKMSDTQKLPKIVVRRLPPNFTSEVFLEQIQPLPEFSYYYFMAGGIGEIPFSRAYIQFKNNQDILEFQERWDNYVFLDDKGNEFPAVVEYAPYSAVPHRKNKPDPRAGTIENDPDYLKFLENLKNTEQEQVLPADNILEDIEAKEKNLKVSHGCPKVTTPLLEFLARKKEEKKQAYVTKTKQKDDDKRKRQTSRESSKSKVKEKTYDENNYEPIIYKTTRMRTDSEEDQVESKPTVKSGKGSSFRQTKSERVTEKEESSKPKPEKKGVDLEFRRSRNKHISMKGDFIDDQFDEIADSKPESTHITFSYKLNRPKQEKRPQKPSEQNETEVMNTNTNESLSFDDIISPLESLMKPSMTQDFLLTRNVKPTINSSIAEESGQASSFKPKMKSSSVTENIVKSSGSFKSLMDKIVDSLVEEGGASQTHFELLPEEGKKYEKSKSAAAEKVGESKQRIRYKDRPERAIYRPGQRHAEKSKSRSQSSNES